MSDITDKIEANAQKLKKTAVDGVQTEQHDLSELIAADRYLKGEEAAKSPKRGLSIARLKPPGAV